MSRIHPFVCRRQFFGFHHELIKFQPDIRDVADAHKVLEAVRLNILPLIRRRLVAHERAQLKSGNVFVWEESEESDEGGLVRWTEGRRW